MDIRRKKNKLRKEMAMLIDSIKEHSDDIGNKDHVAQLELEVINSKIKKLYEKSVVFGYLYSFSEEETQELLNILNDKTDEKLEESELNSNAKTIEKNNMLVESDSNAQTTTTVNESIEEVADSEINQPLASETPVDIVATQNSSQENIVKLRDVKEFIGLNDKIQFVSALFKSDITRYEYFISKLNASQNLTENNNVISDFQKLMNWKDEDEAFQNLLSLTQIRYK